MKRWRPPTAEVLRRRWALREATLGSGAAFGASNVGGYEVPLGAVLRRDYPWKGSKRRKKTHLDQYTTV